MIYFILGIITATIYIKKGFKALFLYVILPIILLGAYYAYHLAA